MPLIFLVNLPLAYKHMIEGFFNQHMEDIVVLMLEKQSNEAPKEFGVADLLEYLHARNGNAVAEDLNRQNLTSRSL